MYLFCCFVSLFLSPCLFQLGWLIDLIDDIVDCYHLSARREIIISYFISSHGLYVARIGVINNKGWLLTLAAAEPSIQNKGSEKSASDDNTHHEYEEIKELKVPTGHRYSYTQSKSIRGSVFETNNNFQPVSHEGYHHYCYEDVPPGLSQHSRHHCHPIYSLTESDIEKAVGPTALDKSRIVCYCFAICLAITFLIAIVMMISNIITKMYLRF